MLLQPGNSLVSPNATTRNRGNAKAEVDGPSVGTSPSSSTRPGLGPEPDLCTNAPTHAISSPFASGAGEQAQDQGVPFDLGSLVDKIEPERLQSNDVLEEESSTATPSNTITEGNEFLELDEVSIPSVTVTIVPFFRGPEKIQILHRDTPLQIHCDALKVRFGLSTRFVDGAGRPRLSFMVDASPNLCGLLDACDNVVKRFVESDSNSEWRPVVSRKPGFYSSPTIRFHRRR